MHGKSYHIILKGRVQGVGFRYHTRSTAQAYEIKGWVRNKADGSVEIEAQGEEENMQQFLSWLKGGPQLARVDHIQINPIPQGQHTDFVIR
jgi:acylphosphatase